MLVVSLDGMPHDTPEENRDRKPSNRRVALTVVLIRMLSAALTLVSYYAGPVLFQASLARFPRPGHGQLQIPNARPTSRGEHHMVVESGTYA
jgi:hypothetical protein